jgi:hypothetical protein
MDPKEARRTNDAAEHFGGDALAATVCYAGTTNGKVYEVDRVSGNTISVSTLALKWAAQSKVY